MLDIQSDKETDPVELLKSLRAKTVPAEAEPDPLEVLRNARGKAKVQETELADKKVADAVVSKSAPLLNPHLGQADSISAASPGTMAADRTEIGVPKGVHPYTSISNYLKNLFANKDDATIQLADKELNEKREREKQSKLISGQTESISSISATDLMSHTISRGIGFVATGKLDTSTYPQTTTKTSKRNYVQEILLSLGVGEENLNKASGLAKAKAVIHTYALDNGLDPAQLSQSPEFMEQVSSSVISGMTLGIVGAFREELTGETTAPPTTTSGHIGYALGSLGGLLTTPVAGAKFLMYPFLTRLPQATQTMKLSQRILTAALHEAAILGPATGLEKLGEAGQSTTFTEAAGKVGHGLVSGALTGALFGVSKGLFPKQLVDPFDEPAQMGARMITGLTLLNAQRVLEHGGNPYTDRPAGEVMFDIALDAYFLYKGLPKESFNDTVNRMGKLAERREKTRQKKELAKSMQDEKAKQQVEQQVQQETQQNEAEGEQIIADAKAVVESTEKSVDLVEKTAEAKIKENEKRIKEIERKLAAKEKKSPKSASDILPNTVSEAKDKQYAKDFESARKLGIIDRIKAHSDAGMSVERIIDQVFSTGTRQENRKSSARIIKAVLRYFENAGGEQGEVIHEGEVPKSALPTVERAVKKSVEIEAEKKRDKFEIVPKSSGISLDSKSIDAIENHYGKDIFDVTDEEVRNFLDGKVTGPAKGKPVEKVMTAEEELAAEQADAEESITIEKRFGKRLEDVTAEEFEKFYDEQEAGTLTKDIPARSDVQKSAESDIDKFIEEHTKKVEPTTEFDTQTGSKEPDHLVGEESIYNQDKEMTDTQTETYSKAKAVASSIEDLLDRRPDRTPKDPATTTWSLINDINRWLHGDEGVDVERARDFLSQLAADADQFRNLFINPSDPMWEQSFFAWKENVSDAANWARKIDKVKNNLTEFNAGIDPFEAFKEIRKLFKRDPESDPKYIADFSTALMDSMRGREIKREDRSGEFSDVTNESSALPPYREPEKLPDIETSFKVEKANILPTLLKDIANQKPNRTLIYELVQNSLDADAKNIDIRLIHTGKGNMDIVFTDDGSGMTAEEVRKFLLVGGSIGKTGVESRGGYGLAKIALFLIPENLKITSYKNGIKSVVETDRDSVVSEEGKIIIKSTKEPGVGTIYEGHLPKEIFDVRIDSYQLTDAVNDISKGTWTTANITASIETKADFDKSGRQPIPTRKPSLLKDVEKKFPSENLTFDGSDMTVHYVKTEPYGEKGWGGKYSIERIVTNKGLIVDINGGYIGAPSIYVKPDFKIVIDFNKTPTVRDPKYPFLKNRTQLAQRTIEELKPILSKTINKYSSGVTVERGAQFGEMVKRSPEYNGIKVLIPYTGKSFDQAKAIIDRYPEVIDSISKITAVFTRMLKNAGEKDINFHITIDPKVHGYKSVKELTGVEIFAINPFSISKRFADSVLAEAQASGKDINQLRGDMMAHTFIHEYTHNKVSGHNQDFTIEIARGYTRIGHRDAADLADMIRSYNERYEKQIKSLTGDLEPLQKTGEGLSDDSQVNASRRDEAGDKGRVRVDEETTGDRVIKFPDKLADLESKALEKMNNIPERTYQDDMNDAYEEVKSLGLLKEFRELMSAKPKELIERLDYLSDQKGRGKDGLLNLFRMFKDKTQPGGYKLYSGIDPDDAMKTMIDMAKRAKAYTARSRELKNFKPGLVFSIIKEEATRAFSNQSGNLRTSLINKLGDRGYDIMQKNALTKGATAKSSNMLRQMRKETSAGLNANEKHILDDLILFHRIIDIGKYKTEKQFKFPKDLTPTHAAGYVTTFAELEGLSPERAQKLLQSTKTYFEWMKKPLKEMAEEGLISEQEYNDLVAHNYRRIGTVDSPTTLADLLDKRSERKIGNVSTNVYDSGIEKLARGRNTDIYEESADLMALETFNRSYGRIANNQANRAMADLARSDKTNAFARMKLEKGDKVPEGWIPHFFYEKGKVDADGRAARQTVYLDPEVSKEWITSGKDISVRAARILKYASMAPLTRTFATGVEWTFALANVPRDIAQIWWSARTFENGKWKSVYNPILPVYSGQIGRDLVTVFSDALLHKGRYNEMASENGLMDFLAKQASPFSRGLKLEGPGERVYNFFAAVSEISELAPRLAIRERVIRNKANELGISMEEARKDKKITQEATFAARDYMDYAQGGYVTKAADQAIPFLNAGIVGLSSFARTFMPGSGTAAMSTFKLAQYAAGVVGIYLASKWFAPNTHEDLKRDINSQNNITIPLGDQFSFLDEQGQTRHIYAKIPLNQNLRFFKKFFEASTDKWLGEEVDAQGTANALSQLSPVGLSSLPPTAAAGLGYAYNIDFWRGIGKKITKETFDYPDSAAEFGTDTPVLAKDVGSVTGASPDRLNYMARQLFANSMWAELVGVGYEKMFKDLPKNKKEQHIAAILARTPGFSRFIGITNPYSKFAQDNSDARNAVRLKTFIENRDLDAKVDGYLFENNVTYEELKSYMRSFDKDTYDRMNKAFRFQEDTKTLPNRLFWLDLHRMVPDARALAFVTRMNKADKLGKIQLLDEFAQVARIDGFITDGFKREVRRLESEK